MILQNIKVIWYIYKNQTTFFNSPIYKFDKGDWDWCPVHKGTKRQFECHTSITAKMVVDQIKHIL